MYWYRLSLESSQRATGEIMKTLKPMRGALPNAGQPRIPHSKYRDSDHATRAQHTLFAHELHNNSTIYC